MEEDEVLTGFKTFVIMILKKLKPLTSTLMRSLVACASLYLALALLCLLFSSRDSFRTSPATPLICCDIMDNMSPVILIILTS